MPNSIAVVLDTSVLYHDYKLSSASLQGMLGVATLGKVTVFLPKVAFDELVNQHAEAFGRIKKQLEETIDEFKHLSVVEVPFSFPTEITYSDSLKNMLKKKGIKLLEYPKVTHEAMIQRFFNYHKPLGKHKDKKEQDKDDAGYKDALIWENILELLGKKYHKIVLVSANKSDFGDADGSKLNEELKEDLIQHGCCKDSVQYASSLKECSKLLRDICLLTSPALIKTVAAQIKRNVDFDDLLTNHQIDIQDAITRAGEILIGDGADDPYLSYNIEKSEVKIESTEVLEESGEVVVYANAKFENEVEYYMFLSDYYCMDNSLDNFGISLYEELPDSDRALVGGDMQFLLEFNFIYNPTTHETSEFEVVDIQRTDIHEK